MLTGISLNSHIDLEFFLERIQTSSQIDSMVEGFTTALLEARTTAVQTTVPFRCSLVLTPEIKALIARKNTLRRIAQRTKNSGGKKELETLKSIVKDICQELQNKNFGQKLSTIQPNHKSLFNFTKLIKNKSRGVPALKVDGVTLLTGPKKTQNYSFQILSIA
jgi:hypothetical protein